MSRILLTYFFCLITIFSYSENIKDSIDFNYDYGYIIIKAEINKKEYSFLFDTGARTSITKKVINDLKLLKISSKPFDKYKVSILITSCIKKDNFNVKTTDFPLKKIINGGIIGYDFFKNLIFSIDYNKRKIYFLERIDSLKNGIKFNVNFYTNPNGIIKLNDKIINVVFDTGYSSGSGISLAISKENLKVINIDTLKVNTLEYHSELYGIIKQKEYFIGKINIPNSISEDKIEIQKKFNLNLLGNTFFEKYLTTFDFVNNYIYLTMK